LFIFPTPVLIRHLWLLKAVVFLHWCVIRVDQLNSEASEGCLRPQKADLEVVNSIFSRLKPLIKRFKI
jgi:hypothetical protein